MKILSKIVVKKLINKKIKLSVAESCTGGLLSKAITSIPGSSKIFKLGLITYSNESKTKVLNVPKNIIKKYGAVSEEVCRSMVKNVSIIGETAMSLSITGIAGPGGGTQKKPVGLVFIGIKKRGSVKIIKYLFKNKNRSYIQNNAVNKSLNLILNTLK